MGVAQTIKGWTRVFADRQSAAPPIAPSLDVEPCLPDAVAEPANEASTTIEPISGFTCVIEYKDAQRLISCQRFQTRGDIGHVLAVCLTAGGFRDFRTDRITCVYDPQTGEVLGDGTYFRRFAVDAQFQAAPTWGLSRSRQVTLIAGLNVLAFMAHCDGNWHPLETEPVERFVCSLWLRREWEGDPPLAEIVAHAQRLSPDSETFFRSVNHYARSHMRSGILRQAVADLIAADGVICDEEFDWAQAFSDCLAEMAR